MALVNSLMCLVFVLSFNPDHYPYSSCKYPDCTVKLSVLVIWNPCPSRNTPGSSLRRGEPGANCHSPTRTRNATGDASIQPAICPWLLANRTRGSSPHGIRRQRRHTELGKVSPSFTEILLLVRNPLTERF